ncbi:MAG: LD-carboxypeptidase [Ignavibacteria bacterium]|nr:LD-carboxypeptidase [Ignavibacteria bacterium]MBI3766191.1 LD-carboxypeptidase [Ignavibacteriales bacterium]
MRIIKPKRLRPGDTIGICAPSSPPTSATSIDKGIAYIESLGFRVEVGKNVFRKSGYLAGSDAQRAADLNALFANPKVHAIFTVRGGYGAHRILPHLDYSSIKRNPKIVLGYSDITAIHLALFSKVGLVSFSGPMVAVEMCEGLKGETEELFWRALMSRNPMPPFRRKADKHIRLKNGRLATGRLLGGNLSLMAALVGTRFFPHITNPIYLLEETDERPYRIDRMLQQMNLGGLFQHVGGMALGVFTDCDPTKGKPSLSLRRVFQDTFQATRCPIVSGFQYGHIKNSLPFPIGIRVALDGRKGTLQFLESGLS